MSDTIISKDQQEQQRKAAIRQTFNTVADHYGTGGTRFFHSAGQTMAELAGLQGNEHVLDVASGTGATALPLAQKLSRGKVTATDFSERMLEQAQHHAKIKGLNNLDFQIQDMTAMTFNNKSFDHAFCSFGLFFVEDMTGLLRHIASKVKPGGKVMVSGFCGDSFMPMVQLIFKRLQNYGIELPEQPLSWKRMAEPEQLHALFSQAGLKNVVIVRKSLGYYIDAEGWWEVVWNAGFRGVVAQLGDRLDSFRREHLAEVQELADSNGLWLEVDVNFTSGIQSDADAH